MITLSAPAKLTVSLRLTGLRSDGMHLIDAEMVSVDLFDTLRITEGTGVYMAGPAAGDLVGRTDGTDLVSRALRMIGRDVRVDVDKQIPAGAGLGGGSSDAAAILRWGGFDDLDAAAKLGADVAFCLAGSRARVSGIGEIVEPLPPVDRTFTLLTPPVHCSTPVVYRRWDAMGGPTAPDGAVDPNDLTDGRSRLVPRDRGVAGPPRGGDGADPAARRQRIDLVRGGDYPGDGRRVVTTIGGPAVVPER
ncbi:MAG: 4-(cytidine 5'-diphospho)-2-C-methyl-D-erythritol kinase [Microthrixaceae bacterium]